MNDFDKDKFRDTLRDSIHRDVHDRIEEKMRRRAARRQRDNGAQGVVWGGVICIVGLLLLLDHMGYIAVDHLWRFWPLIPMIVGAVHMSEPGRRLWGGIVLLVGALFLLDTLGIARFDWEQIWPVAIIVVGGVMIWNSLEAQRRRRADGSSSSIPDTDSTVSAQAIFGGVERRITMQDFRFGRVSAVFGGVVLDFHDAGMDGDKAEIGECRCFWRRRNSHPRNVACRSPQSNAFRRIRRLITHVHPQLRRDTRAYEAPDPLGFNIIRWH